MIKTVALAGSLVLSSVSAMAAPFCLAISGTNPQCIYSDGAACAREAGRQNGSCQVNPDEVRIPPSLIGNYCVVLPSGSANCGYGDGNVCSREALLQKGACVRSAGSGPAPIPNDYAPNANR